MKNWLIILAISPLIFFSCEEKESCDDTSAPIVNAEVRAGINVYQGNDPVKDYPVRVIWQKTFCGGDKAFPAEYPRATDEYGKAFAAPGLHYMLTNEKDFITVFYYAGSGDSELGYSEQYSYDEFKGFSAMTGVMYTEHTFYINQ